jgi:hypothetical protein
MNFISKLKQSPPSGQIALELSSIIHFADFIEQKTNKMIRRLSDFWSPNETAELDQFNSTWNTL